MPDRGRSPAAKEASVAVYQACLIVGTLQQPKNFCSCFRYGCSNAHHQAPACQYAWGVHTNALAVIPAEPDGRQHDESVSCLRQVYRGKSQS